jgi:hypothetical protein
VGGSKEILVVGGELKGLNVGAVAARNIFKETVDCRKVRKFYILERGESGV